MRKKPVNRRSSFRKSLLYGLRRNRICCYILLLMLLDGCRGEQQQAYVAFYNYSEHGGISVAYVEFVLPVPFAETRSKYNDTDYLESGYVKGAELVTSRDTVDLKYNPLRLRGHFFSLISQKVEPGDYSSYILQLDEPYKWGSLYQADSLLAPLLQKLVKIRYLDTSGIYQSLNKLDLKPIYFSMGSRC